MTTQGKIILAGSLAAALLAIGGAVSWGSGLLVGALGKPPFVSKEYFDVLAQYNLSELAGRQIQLQMEIDRLKVKCQTSCSTYERDSLRNYLDQWQRNQGILENMRRFSVQQFQYQYPSAGQR